ncbi:MAG: RNA-binding domain-containing protein [Bacteroidales bacterium]
MELKETNRIEFKRELTNRLENEVVAFLNYREGGKIYIGIDDDGKIIGVPDADSVQLKIKDRLKTNIVPSCLGLFDVVHEVMEGKDVIKIDIASGSEKPYYLKKAGMSVNGCFIRVGTACEPMDTRQIEDLFARRTRNSLNKIKSNRQDLTFEQLRIYYDEKGLTLNEHFLGNLELLTEEGKLNYIGYLMADENGNSIKVAKYAGTDKIDLIENNEYGYCSLVKATNRVLEKLNVENKTLSKITYPRRIDTRLWDEGALREAVINAIIHNDYTREIPPVFEIYSDRIEITSYGGLFEGMTEDEFFTGLSLPRNKELMRIYRDLGMVEQLGSGIPRILKSYDRSCFRFSNSFIRMSFPINEIAQQELEQDSDRASTEQVPSKYRAST